MKTEAEDQYFQLLLEERRLQEEIKSKTIKLEEIGQRIMRFDYSDWWHSSMCHNQEECGTDCANGCDMPHEIWKFRVEEIKRKVSEVPLYGFFNSNGSTPKSESLKEIIKELETFKRLWVQLKQDAKDGQILAEEYILDLMETRERE